MKMIIAFAIAAATFAAAPAADARPHHHSHRVCTVHHHHRVCHMVR